MNPIIQGLLKNVTFVTKKGVLSVGDLFKVPLRSKDDFNLDVLAQRIHQKIESTPTKSFVDDTKSVSSSLDILCLDIVKEVIKLRKEEEQLSEKRKENAVLRKQYEDVINRRNAEAFDNMTAEEAEKHLKALDADS